MSLDWKQVMDKDNARPKAGGADQQMVEMRDRNGRSVLIPAERHEKLLRGERVVMRPGDFTESEIEAILNAPLHPDCYLYDDEVE